MNTSKHIVKDAIQDIGGISFAANYFKIAPASVFGWVARNSVPAKRSVDIEKLTNGKFKCEQLCPSVDWSYIRKSKKS